MSDSAPKRDPSGDCDAELIQKIRKFGAKDFDRAAVADAAFGFRPEVIASDRRSFLMAVIGNAAWFDEGKLPEILRYGMRTMGVVAGGITLFRFLSMWIFCTRIRTLSEEHLPRLRQICQEVRMKIPALIPQVDYLERTYAPREENI